MKAFSKEYRMYLKRVSSRLFSSAGETATNKGPSFNLKYVTDESKIIGAIGAAIFVFSKIEIDSLKTSVKDSEARISNIINQIKVDMKSDIKDSEARTSNIINQIKVDMKSDIKESEDRMRNEMTLSEQRIKSDIKASEIRIFQKIDDALEGKK